MYIAATKLSALALMGAIAFTNTAQMHPFTAQMHPFETEMPAPVAPYSPVEIGQAQGNETLVVYYSPLPATEVAKYLGFGIAYHMAVVYTDSAGHSYGASARPSNLKAALTPQNAFDALLDLAKDEPSAFGTLIADTRNNTMFVRGALGDFYTLDSRGRSYPHSVVKRGKNLSRQWKSIVQTYERTGALGLTYSPTDQNSNSLAGTALRRAGVGLDFSRNAYFAPGAYTVLPIRRAL